VNLQERESSILGVAPRKFLPSGFSEEEKGKENSGLLRGNERRAVYGIYISKNLH